MIKINVVDLQKLYNFVVKNFLIWIRLGLQNSIWNFLCLVFYFSLPSVKEKHSPNNFQIEEIQMKFLNDKMISKQKVINYKVS